MGQGSLIRQSNRERVPLEHATRYARETGAIEPTETLRATIRRVTALEITRALGTPPAMLRAARERDPKAGEEAWQKRWQELLAEDPELARSGQTYTVEIKRLVIACGCVDPRVELEPSDDPEVLLPEDFGLDLEDLYEAIVTHSGLPFRLREGADASSAFPAGPARGGAEPDGALLRPDADAAAEPDAGRLVDQPGALPG